LEMRASAAKATMEAVGAADLDQGSEDGEEKSSRE
jgi:hypothetical protein